jgi:hypothetical protein
MTAIYCPKCGGGFVCAECGFPLRKVPLEPSNDTSSNPNEVHINTDLARNYPAPLRQYLEAFRSRRPYVLEFPRGPRGGAVIDFGNMIRLECFLPYFDEEGALPFAVMPLDGSAVHDLERSERVLCESGSCNCERPTGWKVTMPILRQLLGGVSSAFLHEHGQQLPGRLPCWCTCVSTLPFLRECLFDSTFKFPTREASRAERRNSREAARHRQCKPPRPSARNGRLRRR